MIELLKEATLAKRVRAIIRRRLDRGHPVTLRDITERALARHGALFGEEMVRDAARRAFDTYRPGRYCARRRQLPATSPGALSKSGPSDDGPDAA